MVKQKTKNNFEAGPLMAYLAIVVIIVSLANFGFRLTGKATDTATINVTIDSSANIAFVQDMLEFGRGNVIGSNASATLYSNGSIAIGGNWSAVNKPLVLENVGNLNVTIDLASNVNAITLLGGTNPSFQYYVANNETSACLNTTERDLLTWYNVNATSPGDRICNNLTSTDNADALNIYIKLVIPSDSYTGLRTAVLTATGTAVA